MHKRERGREGERERERERERESQAGSTLSTKPDMELDPPTLDREPKSRVGTLD